MKKPTLPTGRLGEKLAANLLQSKKLKVLKTNWHVPVGEIDILAENNEELVIVEVKTKTTNLYGAPLEMVDRNKIRKLQQLGKYCQAKFGNKPIRFDLIGVDLSVNPPIIEHIENAIYE